MMFAALHIGFCGL